MPLSELVANFTGKAKRAKLHGRPHLVVPTTLIVEGVHNGSQGPLYYPAEEIEKSVVLWNHKPAPLFHPKDGAGKPISACTPASLERDQLGLILENRFDGNRNALVAETWLDEARTKALSPAVYNSVTNGEVVEVSTGLFTENEQVEGEWNGEKYVAIARDYKPDHLAILPGLKGACSVEDGAGLGINERAKALEVIRQLVLNEVNNELSHDALRDKLRVLIRQAYGDAYLQDVFDSFLVYELGSRFYQIDYSMAGDSPSLGSDPVMVDLVREYRPAETSVNNVLGSGNESDMEKEKLVDGLIANEKSGFEKSDKETLMKWSEEKLKKFAANLEAPTPEKKEEPQQKVENEKKDPPAPALNADQVLEALKAMPADKVLAALPPAVGAIVANAAKTEKLERERLIKTITANDRSGVYTEEKLKGKTTDDLRDLRTFLVNQNGGGSEDLLDQLAAGYDFSGGAPDLVGNASGVPEAGIGHPSHRQSEIRKAGDPDKK